MRGELGGTGVHSRVDWEDAQALAIGTHPHLTDYRRDEPGDERVAQAHPFSIAEQVFVQSFQRPPREDLAEGSQLLNLAQKPRVDLGEIVDLGERQPRVEGWHNVQDSLWVGGNEPMTDLLHIRFCRPRVEQAVPTVLSGGQSLHQCLAKGAPDGHHLAH